MSFYSALFTGVLPRVFSGVGLEAPALPPAISRRLPRLLGPVGHLRPLRRELSRFVINDYSYATRLRPRALSMASDYTTWFSLNHSEFTGRHLPPADPAYLAGLPPVADVVALFRRDQEVPSTDTSVLFTFFAQWFVDSFLRTDRNDFRKNGSSQQIDLCQIYGTGPAQTQMLRAQRGGRLESQQLATGEYPAFLLDAGIDGARPSFKPRFKGLYDEDFVLDVLLDGVTGERLETVFAVGLEHGNSTVGNTIMNTLFLREHNRIAGLVGAAHPDWDDDRLFETTRNTMIVLLLKIVVEDYIRHIAPFDFPLEAVPLIADEERWNRPNWVAIEFNLLYRWHPLVPDAIPIDGAPLTADGFLNNNPFVIEKGLDDLVTQLSRARAGKIQLFNTPKFLVDSADEVERPSMEWKTVTLSREARLRSYNDYRESYGLPRLTGYGQLTHDPAVRARLEQLYPAIDDLEWYVGLFAESYPDYLMMGKLLTTMVANDAFTQALTNPLLARDVFTEATFSEVGMRIIGETSSLRQLVLRNSAAPEAVLSSFDWIPGEEGPS